VAILMMSECLRYSCFRWCSWIPPRRYRRERWPSDGSFRPSSSLPFLCRWLCIRCSQTGCGVADGFRLWGRTSGWATGTWTLPDRSMMATAMLAGLVAITAPCAFVTAPSAVVIGLIAGVLVVMSVYFVERKLKVDDPVGAISVHGACGAWGVLSLGLFADGVYGDGWNGVPGTVRGLFYGDASQFIAQCIGTLTCFVFVFGAFYAFFKLVEVTVGNRVSAAVEIQGLDLP